MADTCWVAHKGTDGTFSGFKQIVDWPDVVARYVDAGRVLVEQKSNGEWAEKRAAKSSPPESTGGAD